MNNYWNAFQCLVTTHCQTLPHHISSTHHHHPQPSCCHHCHHVPLPLPIQAKQGLLLIKHHVCMSPLTMAATSSCSTCIYMPSPLPMTPKHYIERCDVSLTKETTNTKIHTQAEWGSMTEFEQCCWQSLNHLFHGCIVQCCLSLSHHPFSHVSSLSSLFSSFLTAVICLIVVASLHVFLALHV